MRYLSPVLEFVGFIAILATAYLLNPVLLVGIGGLIAVAAGHLIDRRPE